MSSIVSATRRPGTSRRPQGWTIGVRPGGIIVADHARSGAIVTGSLVLRAGRDGARLRLVRYDFAVPDGLVSDAPPAPVEWIEKTANEPGMMQVILDSMHEVPTHTGSVQPMRLPPVMLENRERPDAFYTRVAAYVRICKSNRIAYGPRLAADNNVSEGTVRSWVHEARTRGLLDPPTHD